MLLVLFTSIINQNENEKKFKYVSFWFRNINFCLFFMSSIFLKIQRRKENLSKIYGGAFFVKKNINY